jgi:hypothetical protein
LTAGRPTVQQPIKPLVAALETILIDYFPPQSVVPGGSRFPGYQGYTCGIHTTQEKDPKKPQEPQVFGRLAEKPSHSAGELFSALRGLFL